MHQLHGTDDDENDYDTQSWYEICNFVRNNDKICEGCGKPGHTLENCHIFINHVLACKLVKENPYICGKVERVYKKFFRQKRHRYFNKFRPQQGGSSYQGRRKNQGERNNQGGGYHQRGRGFHQGGRYTNGCGNNNGRLTQRVSQYVNQLLTELQDDPNNEHTDNSHEIHEIDNDDTNLNADQDDSHNEDKSETASVRMITETYEAILIEELAIICTINEISSEIPQDVI